MRRQPIYYIFIYYYALAIQNRNNRRTYERRQKTTTNERVKITEQTKFMYSCLVFRSRKQNTRRKDNFKINVLFSFNNQQRFQRERAALELETGNAVCYGCFKSSTSKKIVFLTQLPHFYTKAKFICVYSMHSFKGNYKQ